jgi:hypothetical protein
MCLAATALAGERMARPNNDLRWAWEADRPFACLEADTLRT